MQKKSSYWLKLGLLLMSTLLYSGCSTGNPAVGSYYSAQVDKYETYSEIARHAIEYTGPESRPLVIIHGFLGSRLKDARNDENIWGEIRVSDALGGYSPELLRNLALPMRQGAKLSDLRDQAIPDGLLTEFKVRIGSLTFNVEGYGTLIEELETIGYHRNPDGKGRKVYIFDYDWRRDLPENAIRLGKFLESCRRQQQQEIEKRFGIADYPVKFDLLGHSMGGLLARYFLRYGGRDLPEDGSLPQVTWAGREYVRRAVLAGTPNDGYLDTGVELVNGLQIAKEAAAYPPAVIGTFPTYYQMLPRTGSRSVLDDENQELDLFDPAVWEKYRWGLLSPEADATLKILLPDVPSPEERRAIARDHLVKCLKRAKTFTTAMRQEAIPPKNVSQVLFLGDAVPTSRRAEPVDGKLKVTEYDAGDGKVTSASARLDLRQGAQSFTPYEDSPVHFDTVIHIPGAHMGLMQSPFFRDNLSYQLQKK